jgi:hypothetical protein
LTLVAATLLTVGVSYGQGAERVKDELSRPDITTGARVYVRMSDATATLLATADHNPTRTSVTVYGVRLFSDNSQNARENAYAAAAAFTALQPDIHVDVKYQTPHFLVTAGLFVDRTDAVALSGRVASQFPKAMVVPLEASLAEVIVTERREPTPPAETIPPDEATETEISTNNI